MTAQLCEFSKSFYSYITYAGFLENIPTIVKLNLMIKGAVCKSAFTLALLVRTRAPFTDECG